MYCRFKSVILDRDDWSSYRFNWFPPENVLSVPVRRAAWATGSSLDAMVERSGPVTAENRVPVIHFVAGHFTASAMLTQLYKQYLTSFTRRWIWRYRLHLLVVPAPHPRRRSTLDYFWRSKHPYSLSDISRLEWRLSTRILILHYSCHVFGDSW
jgi:hypothetical protein